MSTGNREGRRQDESVRDGQRHGRQGASEALKGRVPLYFVPPREKRNSSNGIILLN
jgi:hypothetical protein